MTKSKGPWPTVTLGSIATIQSGGTPDRANPQYWEGGTIPWVTTSEVNYSTITQTSECITSDGLANSSAKMFPLGTILMALYGQGKTRGQVGALGIAAATNQACAAIMPDDRLDVDYLYQFLKGSYSSIRALSNTGGQQNLSSQLISEIRVPLPRRKEQARIAAILQTWDEAIKNLLLLSKLREKQYLGLRGHLIDWSKNQRAVKEFLKPVSRPVPKPTSGYRALSIRSHGKGTFERYVENPESVEMDTLYVVKPGDIIVNITFAWEGAVALVPRDHDGCLVSHRFPTFIPEPERVDARYLRHALRMARFTYLLGIVSPGGAGRNRVLSKSDFLDLKVPLLPLDQQGRIAMILDDAEKAITAEERYLSALNRQKRGLMQKLLTGEWRVKL